MPLGADPVCTCVVGLQWGDEAKGKIVDLLTDQPALVLRHSGGPTAGTACLPPGQSYISALLRRGLPRPRVPSVIASGVVVHPPRFLEEVDQLGAAGVSIGDNLAVSDHAHVIFP